MTSSSLLDRATIRHNLTEFKVRWFAHIEEWKAENRPATESSHDQQFWGDLLDCFGMVLLQLGAGAKKAPFLLCDQRYVPVLSGRLEYPANNHCIRIRVTIGKHRALPLPQ